MSFQSLLWTNFSLASLQVTLSQVQILTCGILDSLRVAGLFGSFFCFSAQERLDNDGVAEQSSKDGEPAAEGVVSEQKQEALIDN